jgi:hypothetical protein
MQMIIGILIISFVLYSLIEWPLYLLGFTANRFVRRNDRRNLSRSSMSAWVDGAGKLHLAEAGDTRDHSERSGTSVEEWVQESRNLKRWPIIWFCQLGVVILLNYMFG